MEVAYKLIEVLEEVEPPALSLTERIAWAIVLASPSTARTWAVAWLSGNDRSAEAASAAAEAARAAVWEASGAAAEARLMPALARARAILAGQFPPERFDDPL